MIIIVRYIHYSSLIFIIMLFAIFLLSDNFQILINFGHFLGIGFFLPDITVPENAGPVQIAVDSTANLNTSVTVRYVNSKYG